MRRDHTPLRFFWILFRFILAIISLIISNSFFRIIIGWDGLGISRFFLIIYYQRKNSVECSFITLLTNRVGDVVFLYVFILFFILGSDRLQ